MLKDRVRLHHLVFAAIFAGLGFTCGADNPVADYRQEVNLKRVRHTSPLTYLQAYALGPATEVWTSSSLIRYTEVNFEYLSQEDPCGLDVIESYATAISDPLWEDSAFIARDGTSFSQEALSLVNSHYDSQMPTLIPVFVMPRLARRTPEGILFEPVKGTAVVGGGLLTAGVFLDSRLTVGFSSYSTLAHELAHLLVPPQDARWSHDWPIFLNIFAPLGALRSTVSSSGFNTVSVVADDANRRVLVEVDGSNECSLARRSSWARVVQ